MAIGRALVIGPEFVVADEPTSMLDVSSRAGIMLLMQQLAQDLEISYLHITHDLAVARYMCDRIAVMYLGKIVEVGETEELLHHPLHPYTKALLLGPCPLPNPGHRRPPPDIHGDLALPIDPPPRCRFYDRCPIATDQCRDNPHPPSEGKGRPATRSPATRRDSSGPAISKYLKSPLPLDWGGLGVGVKRSRK